MFEVLSTAMLSSMARELRSARRASARNFQLFSEMTFARPLGDNFKAKVTMFGHQTRHHFRLSLLQPLFMR
jgi:hypothetical protein